MSEGEDTLVTVENAEGQVEATSEAPDAKVDIHFGDLEVHGGHIEATIKKSLIARRHRLSKCYLVSSAAKSRSSKQVRVEFFVHDDGRVSEPKASADGEDEVRECVQAFLESVVKMPNGSERSRVLLRVLYIPKGQGTPEDATFQLSEPF